eukprot:CAMPEP_0174363594 /NCGR_PEP_ID=MMETSP0811_2-20130205/69452_1 /TAXON_ID=73025 ORGANISM="Eutreptiella gymnastica-like, Strain CCMP1594" /NCGR_SAMPLE_ID=MMETSP0811_2 /ASSEMBLY_ACC=CAM_ASM_000667 /LENGTH=118 /DNA_ID=CAMNT_0015502431 /DNA_START=194 /DNA_END=551 /DNA_ORIENTATION=-
MSDLAHASSRSHCSTPGISVAGLGHMTAFEAGGPLRKKEGKGWIPDLMGSKALLAPSGHGRPASAGQCMARDGIAGTMDSAWGLVAIILRGWGAVLGGSGGFGGRGISVPICDVSGAL